jgi:hypothetical protein
MEQFKPTELQIAVEQLIEMSEWGADPEFAIAEDVEEWIADQSGLLRSWDHITEQYTESYSEWLFRIFDHFEYSIFTE